VETELRDVQANIQSNQIQIQSTTQSGGSQNRFDLTIDVNDPRLEIRIDTYTQVVDTSSSSFDFRLKVGSISEYVDKDGKAGYDPVADQTGTVWSFAQNSFTFSQLADSVVGNATVKNFQGKSTDGVFMIIGHISGGVFTLPSAGQILPISFKFDVVIDGSKFHYTLNGSRLAVVASVQSESQSRIATLDDNGNDVTSSGGQRAKTIQLGAAANPMGFFTWAPTVLVNGGPTTANVITSPLVVDSSDHEGDRATNLASA